MHIEPSKWKPVVFKEDDKYYYYFNQEKKVVKVSKEYDQRDGVYRLKWLEEPYRMWNYRTIDGKNAIIPIILSIISGTIIFNLAMKITEREDRMQERAKLPEEFTEENQKENIELKKKIQDWKNQKDLKEKLQKQQD